MKKRHAWVQKWWLLMILLGVVLIAGAAYYLTTGRPSSTARADEKGASGPSDAERVEVAYPLKGVMPRTTTQPGSVQSFEAADLYAGASGYLGTQKVDIGDHVTKGEKIAQVDVPDLDKQVQSCQAQLEAANALIAEMKAGVASALADVEAAKAEVTRAEAAIKSTHATAVFRQKQYDRMKQLYNTPTGPVIDERLVDEHEDERDAAVAAENEAQATFAKAKTLVAAANAKVEKRGPTCWTRRPGSRSPRPRWTRPR